MNSKRVYRLCRQKGLKVRQITRHQRAPGSSANACSRRKSDHMNDAWTWDFVFDRTESGTTLKWLSILDEYTRECLALIVDRTITSEAVINQLAVLFKTRGVPKCIRSDNGPEFISKAIQTWLARLKIAALYIAPGPRSIWMMFRSERFREHHESRPSIAPRNSPTPHSRSARHCHEAKPEPAPPAIHSPLTISW